MKVTLYLRRELTTDLKVTGLKARWPRLDLVGYADPEATQRRARWPWHQAQPHVGRRRVTLNGITWEAIWLPDLEGTSDEG